MKCDNVIHSNHHTLKFIQKKKRYDIACQSHLSSTLLVLELPHTFNNMRNRILENVQNDNSETKGLCKGR